MGAGLGVRPPITRATGRVWSWAWDPVLTIDPRLPLWFPGGEVGNGLLPTSGRLRSEMERTPEKQNHSRGWALGFVREDTLEDTHVKGLSKDSRAFFSGRKEAL